MLKRGLVADTVRGAGLPWRFSFDKPYANPVRWYDELKWWDCLGAARRKMLLASGVYRCKQVLRDPVYEFPKQFKLEAVEAWREWINGVNARSNTGADLLSKEWCKAVNRLEAEEGLSVKLKFADNVKGDVELRGFRFVYGPNVSVNPDSAFAVQHWVEMINLIVPKDEVDFVDHRRQRMTYDRAVQEGAIVQVRARVSLPVTLELSKDDQSILRDSIAATDIWFTTPHLHPKNEIFSYVAKTGQRERNGGGKGSSAGEYKLRFKWMILDVNDALEQKFGTPYGKPLPVSILV